MYKLLRLLVHKLFEEEFNSINSRLTFIENKLKKLENSTQINDMSKAIKGLYDLLCGVIQIGGKR